MVPKDDEILALMTKMMDEQREHRSETSKSFAELDKKVDLHIQKTEYELKRINDQDEIQNQLLDQHIEGVNMLRKIHEAHVSDNEKQEERNDSRFKKLEEPRRFIKTGTKVVVWLGGLGTATMGIVKILSWFLKGH